MNETHEQKRKSVSFRCPLPLYRRMQQHAAALNMDTSEFISAALLHALGTPEELERALAELTSPPHTEQ